MKIVGYEKSCETHFYKLVKEQGIVKKVRISKEEYEKKMMKKGGTINLDEIIIELEFIYNRLMTDNNFEKKKTISELTKKMTYISEDKKRLITDVKKLWNMFFYSGINREKISKPEKESIIEEIKKSFPTIDIRANQKT
jgi:hypothetical protein